MEILDGKKVSSLIKTQIKEKIENEYLGKKEIPCLACILVGDNPASQVYVSSKEKACALVGFKSIIKRLPENSTFDDVKEVIEKLNQNSEVSGILMQLPLPKALAEYEHELIECIAPEKDVDALTTISLGKLFSGHNEIAPCTATGIIDILDNYEIPLQGKQVVVVGRSLLVGKSVAILFEQRNATVTICHSKTLNLEEITKKADIIVVAIGKPKYLTSNMVKDGAIVIDVGINRLETGLVGDVDFDNVKDKCSYITPVPGGVGPMTIAELLKNTLILHEAKENK